MLEDIKPLSRKSGSSASAARAKEPRRRADPLPRELPFEPVPPVRSSRYGLWYIAVGLIVVFLFSLSYLFEHASVTIEPKSSPIAFDTTDTFTAEKDTTNEGAVVFTVMNLSGDESVKIPSTQSKEESLPAKGRVLLYNEYSAAAYPLVKTTRLSTQDGKVYRLDTGVVVPGYKKSGTTITPGSVEVSVTADQKGEASNLENADFTLPGLAGSPQATKIYGRTKTALSGGMSGTVYSISQDVANAALGTLQAKLKSSLISKAKVQVPDGYIFFDGATVFDADDAVQVPYSKEKDVSLALHGTLTAYLIKEDTLVAAIAAKSISQYGGEPVTIPQIASLVAAPAGVLDPKKDTTFSFTLSGQASIVWTVSLSDVAGLLAGKKKSDFPELLRSFSGVERADVLIKPFWKGSFPKDAARISVELE